MIVNESEILWAKTKENAIIPTKEDENAGWDIYACFEEDYLIIPKHQTVLIPTGIASALNKKYYFQIEERGSTGSQGIKKSAGVVDSGYRGEWFIAITNTNDKDLYISKIEHPTTDDVIVYPYTKAIAQAVLHEVFNVESKEVTMEELLQYESIRKDTKLGQSGK